MSSNVTSGLDTKLRTLKNSRCLCCFVLLLGAMLVELQDIRNSMSLTFGGRGSYLPFYSYNLGGWTPPVYYVLKKWTPPVDYNLKKRGPTQT